MKPIISIKEARKILGSSADGMTDEEILEVIGSLHSIAKGAIEDAKAKLQMKRDAMDLANLIYDIYQDKKNLAKTDT
jgi:hypothetical protein